MFEATWFRRIRGILSHVSHNATACYSWSSGVFLRCHQEAAATWRKVLLLESQWGLRSSSHSIPQERHLAATGWLMKLPGTARGRWFEFRNDLRWFLPGQQLCCQRMSWMLKPLQRHVDHYIALQKPWDFCLRLWRERSHCQCHLASCGILLSLAAGTSCTECAYCLTVANFVCNSLQLYNVKELLAGNLEMNHNYAFSFSMFLYFQGFDATCCPSCHPFSEHHAVAAPLKSFEAWALGWVRPSEWRDHSRWLLEMNQGSQGYLCILWILWIPHQAA